jgi:ubiquinone/menaquinone biosynthesis C-methylase UbiE
MNNTEQIDDWNGEQGRRWAAYQQGIDVMVEPFAEAALQAAAAVPGEQVLDIGCGCGGSTLTLARSVAPGGRVLGVDISRPMLQVAQQLVGAYPGLDFSFAEADASQAALPEAQDLLHSRFGLMFFADPVAGLRHLGERLRPGGRCAFVCWRAPRDNPWAMAPLVAARKALGIDPPPADPLMPGPFAFADGQRLHSLLQQAGFEAIELQRLDAPVSLGASTAEAAQQCLRMGPVSRLAREAGAAQEPRVLDAVERALRAHAEADGSVRLGGSTWVVHARRGG